MTRLRSRLWPALALAAAIALAVWLLRPAPEDGESRAARSAPGAEGRPLRYDAEYPRIGYSSREPSDPVAALAARIAGGEIELEPHAERGRLDALLEALDIDPASQVLVFSATSLQSGRIGPSTPRAIYFNDDVYVAWVQGGGPIEIASMDPALGPVFYTLEQSAAPALQRRMQTCLRCHDSLSLTGGGVPRFIVGSGYIGPGGRIVAHEGWILTSQRTPLKNRWGGWYVTGRHGDQVHLGNIVVRDPASLAELDRLRRGNLDDLEGLVDTDPYIAAGSDIVALLVMQHQVDVQNEIARVAYELSTPLHEARREGGAGGGLDALPAATRELVAEIAEPLVEAMLFVGEAELDGPITGSSAFAERFQQRGPRDGRGRSLRELDLERRLLRYPLSYLVYSAAFDALPAEAIDYVYRRLAEVLAGQDRAAKFDHLSPADRSAVREILADTKPAFADATGGRPR